MVAEVDRSVADPLSESAAAVMEVPIVDDQGAGSAGEAPKKPKGSRWNAVKHSLMSKILFTEDLEAEVKRWTAVLTDEFVPTNDYELGRIKTMGRAGAQLERFQQLKVIDLQRSMDRAALCWHTDMCASVDKIAGRLSRDPARVARALARTRQGADWLLENLVGLLKVRAIDGAWNTDQCRFIADLLGIRHELRSTGGANPTEADTTELVARVESEAARLEKLQDDYLIALDLGAKAMGMAGMPGEEDAETKRHLKYEKSARREYEVAKAELLASRARGAAGTAEASPEVAAPPAAAPSNREPEADLDPESEVDSTTRQAASAPAAEEVPPDPSEFRIVEVAPVVEPISLADLAAVRPEKACVASNASRTAAPNERRVGGRRMRRAQAKAAREAARRKGP